MPLWSFSDVLPGTEPEPGQTGAVAARPASGSPATDMVDDPGSVSDGAVAGFAFAAAPVDFRALAHLKWAPRQQPERAVEVKRAVRDAVDRSGLGLIMTGPVPTRALFHSLYAGTMPATAVDARYELALRRWWDLNTALYYLLSAAVVHSGPLAWSDIAFVDKRYVRGPWRDGRGYSQWLFSFGDEANVRTQQSLT